MTSYLNLKQCKVRILLRYLDANTQQILLSPFQNNLTIRYMKLLGSSYGKYLTPRQLVELIWTLVG